MAQRTKRQWHKAFALTFTLLLLSQSTLLALAQETQETQSSQETEETTDNSGSGNSDDGNGSGNSGSQEDEDESDEDDTQETEESGLPPRTLEDRERMRHDMMEMRTGNTQESMEHDLMETHMENRGPRVKEGLEALREGMHRRAGFVLVQWGYVENPFEDQEKFEWNGSVTVSDGAQLKLMREVLFEDNDSVSQESEDMPVNIAATTTVHWDGLLLRVKPERPVENVGGQEGEDVTGAESTGTREGESYDLNTVITVVLNGIPLEVSLRELFENGKIVEEVAGGRQIVIRNMGGPRHLGDDVRERVFEAKDKALNAQERVEKFIKKLLEEGSITQEQYTRLQEVFSRLFGATLTDGLLARLQAKFSGLRERLQNGELSVDILIEEVSALADNLESSGQQERFEAGIIPFCDTRENDWFTEDVQFLKDSDIVGGDAGKCTFRPGDSVSRAELLKMAVEAAGDAGLLPSDNTASGADTSGGEVNGEAGDGAAPEDSRGHWARRYIAFGLQEGAVSGYSDGFRPNQAVTRAEAVKIVLNILGIAPSSEELSALAADLAAEFPDTRGHWGAALIAYAQQIGLVDGDPNGNFRPNAPLNRAEAAKIIRAAVEYILSEGV